MISFLRSFLFIGFVCLSQLGLAQDYSNLQKIKLKKAKHYAPVHDQVVECANYLFDNPIDPTNLDRMYAGMFVFRWATGSPDFTFTIEEKAGELLKAHPELFFMYMASLSRRAIQQGKVDMKSDDIKAMNELRTYCLDKKNNIELTEDLRRIIGANQS